MYDLHIACCNESGHCNTIRRTAPAPALSVAVHVSASKLRRLWETDLNWRSGLLFFLGECSYSASALIEGMLRAVPAYAPLH